MGFVCTTLPQHLHYVRELEEVQLVCVPFAHCRHVLGSCWCHLRRCKQGKPTVADKVSRQHPLESRRVSTKNTRGSCSFLPALRAPHPLPRPLWH